MLDVRFQRNNGHGADGDAMSAFDPNRTCKSSPERFIDLHRDDLVRLSDPLVTCPVPPLEAETRLPI